MKLLYKKGSHIVNYEKMKNWINNKMNKVDLLKRNKIYTNNHVK